MDKEIRTDIGGNEMKIYHTETQADYDSLMVELEEQGVKWPTGTNPTEANHWPEFERQTGIKLQDCILTYHGVEYFEREYPETPIIKHTAKKETQLPEWANWLARDEDEDLYAYENKPIKSTEDGEWFEFECGRLKTVEETDDTFEGILWTHDEPTKIKRIKGPGVSRTLSEELNRIINAKAHGYDEVPTIADKTEPVYIDIDVTKITVDEPTSISFEDTMSLVENKVDDIADKRYEKHRNLVDELHNIYVAKNKDYGNSFGESIDEFGIIAGVVRIGDKYNRLKTLAKGHEPLVNDESMVDTLKDMANYCLLTVLELEEEK